MPGITAAGSTSSQAGSSLAGVPNYHMPGLQYLAELQIQLWKRKCASQNHGSTGPSEAFCGVLLSG